MAEERKKHDWEAIKREWRAGQLSIREIARQHDISDAAIHQKKNRDAKAGKPWGERDLSDRVRKRVKAKLVVSDGVSNNVSANNVREDEIVESAADRGVEVIVCQRKDIRQARQVTALLLSQLNEYAGDRPEIEEEIKEETEGDKTAKRRNRMLKAISLPSHAGTARDLSTAMKNLITLENKAFNLEDGKVDLEEILDALPDDISRAVRSGLREIIS